LKSALKNEMRRAQQAEHSAIRFLQSAEAFCRVATRACTHSSCRIYIPTINWRSANYRSAHDLFSQFSHSFECGAVRFLFWWLFLHRRLRSGNEAQLALNHFAPFGGSSSKGYHPFLSEWLERISRLSLAEPFGSASGRH
jgi:hypothetical protein